MKYLNILNTLFISLICICFSYGQQTRWLKDVALGANLTLNSKMALDAQNHSYLVGSCNGTLTVGTSTILPSSMNSFLSAYDEDGNLLWYHTWKPSNNSAFLQVRNVVVDAAGDIIVCGQLYGTLSISTLSISSVGFDIYIAKFDNAGTILWIKKYGGPQCDEYIGQGELYADKIGNIYMCGYYNGLGAVFGSYTLSNTGDNNSFVTKMDADGNVFWARSFKNAINNANCLSSDTSGHVYVGGLYANATCFDTFTLTVPSSSTGNYFYLAQLDDLTGNCNWVKKMGQALYAVNPSVCNDPYGNSYFTGTTAGAFSIGSLSIATVGYKGFITKLNTSGNEIWLKEIMSSNNSMSRDIEYLPDGSMLLTGDYLGNASFGTYSVSSSGNENSFVTKLDSSGNFKWVKTTTGSNFSYAIATNNSTDIYFSGISSSSINLDTISINHNFASLYLAKISDNNLVGLSETSKDFLPIIYPNPNNGQITLESKKELDILLVNLAGQTVLKQHLHVGTNKLNLNQQENGIYFIQILGSKTSYKLIKQ